MKCRFLLAALLAFASPVLAGGPPTNPVTFEWTAPGDDWTTGLATFYEMRCSPQPITLENWSSANIVGHLPAPATPGTLQRVTINVAVSPTPLYYAMRTRDNRNNWSKLSNVVFSQSMLDAAPPPSPTTSIAMSTIWPQPAHTHASFTLRQVEAGLREVGVYDPAGRRVRLLERGWRPAGSGDVAWDLRDDSGHRVPPGLYLVRARSGGASFTRRVVVINT